MFVNKKSYSWSFIAVITYIFAPASAHAYIDPGSGSMILQLLLAGVAGAAMVCKLYWRRFISIFKRSSNSSDSGDSN